MCSFADQPIPFTYMHLVYFMSMIYLPLFSYTLARGIAVRFPAPLLHSYLQITHSQDTHTFQRHARARVRTVPAQCYRRDADRMLTRPLHDQPSLYGPYTRSSLI